MINSELEKFEYQLKQLAREGKLDVPLSDDAIEFLFDQTEPLKTSITLTSELEKIILRSKKERIQEEAEEVQGSMTFGEYIVSLEEKLKSLLGIDQIREYLPVSLTDDAIKRIKNDQIDKVKVKDIAQLITALCISFKSALILLERSFKIVDLRRKRLVLTSNARVNEQLNTVGRYKTTMNSMQKLLLLLDSEMKLTDIEKEWLEFKQTLEQKLQQSKYI